MAKIVHRKGEASESSWERAVDKISQDSGLDLSFLDSLSDEDFKDEVIRLPYEDISPLSSFQVERQP